MFLPEKVKKSPNGPKMVPNDQQQVDWPIWAILDPLGPLCILDKPTMFGYFWSKWGHFEATPCRYQEMDKIGQALPENSFLAWLGVSKPPPPLQKC